MEDKQPVNCTTCGSERVRKVSRQIMYPGLEAEYYVCNECNAFVYILKQSVVRKG